MSIISCELIVIGEKKQKKEYIRVSQDNSLGAVILFKMELDSNNVPAAASMYAHPNGKRYLALEQYENYPEFARLGRVLNYNRITSIKTDTLNSESMNFRVEFDYLRWFTFVTRKIDENWYIVSYDG